MNVMWLRSGFGYRVWTAEMALYGQFKEVSSIELHTIIEACRLMGGTCNEVEDND